MKNAKYGFVYITTNLINNKKYIEQCKFHNTWKYYLGSGKLIKRAIEKYGKENFRRRIIEYADSKEELNNLEIELIKKYNAVKSDMYYNLADGGKGGNKFAHMTREEKEALRKKMSEGVKNSEKHKKALAKFWSCPKARAEASERAKQRRLSDKGKEGLRTEKRMEACRRNFAKASKLNQRPVIQMTLEGEFLARFDSIKDACIKLNVKQLNTGIGKCCRGVYETAHGFKWKYEQEVR